MKPYLTTEHQESGRWPVPKYDNDAIAFPVDSLLDVISQIDVSLLRHGPCQIDEISISRSMS